MNTKRIKLLKTLPIAITFGALGIAMLSGFSSPQVAATEAQNRLGQGQSQCLNQEECQSQSVGQESKYQYQYGSSNQENMKQNMSQNQENCTNTENKN
ncbi:MAG: hypothetical protein L0Y48_05200 [Fusobacteria bacterium]|nr:hypothetical protein [Fusobacteriota bacterium]